MTQTIKVTLTNTPIDIADSATDSLVTVQNPTSDVIALAVDDRTQAQRTTDNDDIFYLVPSGEERLFSGFAGKISAKTVEDNQTVDIVVIKS